MSSQQNIAQAPFQEGLLVAQQSEGFVSATLLIAEIFCQLWKFLEDPTADKLMEVHSILLVFQKEAMEAKRGQK